MWPRGGWPAAAATLAWLPLLSRADTLDVQVKLYRDANCFERVQELILLDNGCYANLFSNLTKAYAVKIVGFGANQKFDLMEYAGTCDQDNQYSAQPRTLIGGKCERFVGSGLYYAYLKTMYRAATCTTDCSMMNVAVQHFYSEANCRGLPSHTYRYPLQNACLRWFNGTQTFNVDSKFDNISQVDYIGHDTCGGGFTRSYGMRNRRCYPLYMDKEPRSFTWIVEATTSMQAGVSAAQPLGAASLLGLPPLAAATVAATASATMAGVEL